MPNRLLKWDEIYKHGNPTMSVKVNDLIATVKKKECAGKGAPSKAKRAMTIPEFLTMMDIFHASKSPAVRYMVSAANKMQVHMAGRVDDICKFQKFNLKHNMEFPFTLKARLPWSKNILEERDAPDQIVLASMNWKTCVFLALALYFEVWYSLGLGLKTNFVFGDPNPVAKGKKGTKTNSENRTTKAKISNTIRDTVKSDPRFGEDLRTYHHPSNSKRQGEDVATHSLKKLPITMSRQAGLSKDDIDERARWRRRRVQTRYQDVELPAPDAKVAAALCIGGPIKYILKEGSGVTEDWLHQYVMPVTVQSKQLDSRVVTQLALSLLWAAFEPTIGDLVPPKINQRIRCAFSRLSHSLKQGENPVERRKSKGRTVGHFFAYNHNPSRSKRNKSPLPQTRKTKIQQQAVMVSPKRKDSGMTGQQKLPIDISDVPDTPDRPVPKQPERPLYRVKAPFIADKETDDEEVGMVSLYAKDIQGVKEQGSLIVGFCVNAYMNILSQIFYHESVRTVDVESISNLERFTFQRPEGITQSPLVMMMASLKALERGPHKIDFEHD